MVGWCRVNLIFIKNLPFIIDGDTLTPADTTVVYEVKKTKMDVRTAQQNRAFWMWMSKIAVMFNDMNLDITMVLKMDTEWNKDKVKVNLADEVILKYFGKKSSTTLTVDEISMLIIILTKAMGHKGVTLPEFPSIDSLLFEQNYGNHNQQHGDRLDKVYYGNKEEI